jgi:hypothetical protein
MAHAPRMIAIQGFLAGCLALPMAAFAGIGWPDAIGEAIKSVETADFLSAEQKRDILYNNAARFLRLSKAEVEAHHRPRAD